MEPYEAKAELNSLAKQYARQDVPKYVAKRAKELVAIIENYKSGPVYKPDPSEPMYRSGTGNAVSKKVSNGLRTPGDAKDYRSLFGTRDEVTWNDRSTDFFRAVFSGRHHPELLTRAMTKGTPADGGFAVPSEYSRKIHNVSLENELVMPRAFVQPMISNSIHIPAMEIGDHSSNLFGGFTASYVAEEGTISEADPQFRQMELNAHKLTGMLKFSSELSQDIVGGFDQIIRICGDGLSWYRDKAFLKGSGVGEPMGIVDAACTITQAKEAGQSADTIIYENLTGMMSKMYAGGFQNSSWVIHQSCIPQLLQLSVAVGTGGNVIPVMNERNGEFTILTRPVVFTEKTAILGDEADVMLCDFSQYVVGLRSDMRFDTSIHAHFTTDMLLARLIERHDGQPLWDGTMTLEDGTTEVSPFIKLAERT
jgi:HK97 family phage major capsid protein